MRQTAGELPSREISVPENKTTSAQGTYLEVRGALWTTGGKVHYSVAQCT